MFEKRLTELGITLPAPFLYPPTMAGAVLSDGLLYVSGAIPMANGGLAYQGAVGRELNEQEGYAAARLCVLNALAQVRAALGSLDNVARIVKVNGFIRTVPGFAREPQVLNGASDLLVEVFGPQGRAARTAVGVADLPMEAPVEVEMIVAVAAAAG